MQVLNEISKAISAWDVGQVSACRLEKRGVVNHNFILRTSQGKYVLRQVSPAYHKSPRDLEFELSYLDYLKHAGFPYSVPSAIVTKQGSRLNESHLTQLAQMMAEYHALIEKSNLNNGKLASDPYNRKTRLKEIEDYKKQILQEGKAANRQERTFLEEAARLAPILRGFDVRPSSDLMQYPIHRDLISENLIWKQGKLAGVIDFEHVSESNSPVVKDIAVTIQYCCRDSKVTHQMNIDSANQFLQSYTESHPLSEEEIALIPDLMTMGFLEDFVFAFWMVRNDPDRAKRSEEDGYGPTLFSKSAQWSHRNRKRISQALLK